MSANIFSKTWIKKRNRKLEGNGDWAWACLFLKEKNRENKMRASRYQNDSVQFSCSVVSNSLRLQGLQHARPPCPSPTPRIHSDSRPSSQWCRPAISSSVVPFSSCPQSPPTPPPSIRVFSNESTLLMRWPKYWSFSFSIIPSKEIPGLTEMGKVKFLR